MVRIEKRPEANLDLYEIWEYIAVGSPARADQIIRKINETFELLTEHPEMGRAQDDLEPGLRSFPVIRWVIFYRPLPFRQGIEVVRVLHGRQDRERELDVRG